MWFLTIFLAALGATTYAQSSSSSSSSSRSSVTISGTNTPASGGDYPTGSLATYASYTATITLSQSSNSITVLSATTTATSNSTLDRYNSTSTTNGTTSATQTFLIGSSRASANGTASRISSSARATNTQPCNGYPELCNRKYSNITQVAAHNSPFNIRGNVASNQALDVTTQLNDGIRMLQFQVHKPNSTSSLFLCHTSCDLLNAGTLVDYLTTVRQWLDQNPYDVLTILMGNYDFIDPGNFIDPIYNSGLNRYVYTPPAVPMGLSQWPTLGEMIITQRRVVIMLDYQANQTAIPWLLDEFANMWETPFSPTDPTFPCTQDRPPNQARNISEDRMYIANHNLNVEISIASISLLIPASTLLNQTNAATGSGSAGATSQNCTADWGRPPNFLLVDYYNIGSFNGSVFQAAADANGVTYNRDSCCGTGQRSFNAASSLRISSIELAVVVCVIAFMMI
ncbi:hypothetical protein H2198_007878 [Neophaeococcomyces mojaviensis]|uniref:Uncharacterized protein n=1 Tax=Neophaeococcomyces mojaviensis TaxID=3383035 RepID=A0ACC2ZYN7_9EURO|nr:hypothetical protein H2198_007878 [Knufia sp. JES_112]